MWTLMAGWAAVGWAAPGSFVFQPSGMHGGGGFTIIKQDPSNPDRLLAGGDNSGVYVSLDGGASWAPRRLGMTDPDHLSVADLLITSTGQVLAAVGRGSSDGSALFYNANVWNPAIRWRNIDELTSGSTEVTFSGARENNAAYPAEYNSKKGAPRQSGTLLAIDESCSLGDACVYAGTWSNGIRVWVLDGASVVSGSVVDDTQTGVVRSLVVSPSGDSLFVGTLFDGLIEIPLSFAGATPTYDPAGLALSAPCVGSDTEGPTVEDLALADDGTLYIAAGAVGILSYDGLTCTRIYDGPCPAGGCTADDDMVGYDGPYWRTLALVEEPGTGTGVYGGAVNPQKHASERAFNCDGIKRPKQKDAVIYRAPGGTVTTMMEEASANYCAPTVYGTTELWWRGDDQTDIAGLPQKVTTHPGRSSFRAADLAVFTIGSSDRLFVAGSSGVYARGVTTAPQWQPYVHGLQGTNAVTVMPMGFSTTSDVWMGIKDYFGLRSTGLLDVVELWDVPARPEDTDDYPNETTAMAADRGVADRFYVGTRSKNPSAAHFLACDGDGTLHCDKVTMVVEPPIDGWRVASLVTGALDASTQVLFAAIVNEAPAVPSPMTGVWRCEHPEDPASVCVKVPMGEAAMARLERTTPVRMTWAGGLEPLVIYNGYSGFWYADASMPVFPFPAPVLPTTATGSGHVVPDGDDAKAVWVTTDTGLRQFQVSPPSSMPLQTCLTPSSPSVGGRVMGPLAYLEDNQLIVTLRPNGATPAGLLWVDCTTGDTKELGGFDYRSSALFPQALTPLPTPPSGCLRAAVAVDGGGVVVGEEQPVSGATCP